MSTQTFKKKLVCAKLQYGHITVITNRLKNPCNGSLISSNLQIVYTPLRGLWTYSRLVPGLKNVPVPVLLTRKIRYTNKAAPVQRPFLLAGELASPAGRVLRVSSTGTGMFFRPGTNLLSYSFFWKNIILCCV